MNTLQFMTLGVTIAKTVGLKRPHLLNIILEFPLSNVNI